MKPVAKIGIELFGISYVMKKVFLFPRGREEIV